MKNCGVLLVIPIWGCIGTGTTKFGFHNVWEVRAFSVIDCAAVASLYAFSATMLSDPIVSGFIIDRTDNTWKGFPFSLSLTVVGYACICFVDVKKGKEQCERYVLEDPALQKVEG